MALLFWAFVFSIPLMLFKPGTFFGNFYRLNIIWLYLALVSSEKAKTASVLLLGVLYFTFFFHILAAVAARKGVPIIELGFTYFSFYFFLPVTGNAVFSALITTFLVWGLYELVTKRLAPFKRGKRFAPIEDEG